MGWKIICLFVFLFSTVEAQNLSKGEREGLIQVTGSIYPSIHLNVNSRANYVGGQLEYYFDDCYSVRGSALVYIGKHRGSIGINDHALISVGLMRNWSWKKSELYLGFAPGLSRIQEESGWNTYYQPTVSGIFGGKFHVSPYFYFFAETQFQHAHAIWRPGPFSQLLFTGGLGLQFPTRKFKSGDV